jgi:hypothetical protein
MIKRWHSKVSVDESQASCIGIGAGIAALYTDDLSHEIYLMGEV